MLAASALPGAAQEPNWASELLGLSGMLSAIVTFSMLVPISFFLVGGFGLLARGLFINVIQSYPPEEQSFMLREINEQHNRPWSGVGIRAMFEIGPDGRPEK
jgi:hypothetical protein